MPPSDELLVSQAVSLRDTAAFAELVRRHQPKILLLQRRLIGEPGLAEDLAQETFFRAWQKLDTFRASGSFSGWLASLAYNVFRAHWRKASRQRKEVPLDELLLPSVTPDPSAGSDLDRLLGVLDRQDQIIMVLSYAHGLTNTEVGQTLGMPAGTIKARIHRAKEKIRSHFQDPTHGAAITDPGDSGPAHQEGDSTPAQGRHQAGKGFRAALTGDFSL